MSSSVPSWSFFKISDVYELLAVTPKSIFHSKLLR